LNELTKKFFKFKNIKPEDYGKFNLNLNMKNNSFQSTNTQYKDSVISKKNDFKSNYIDEEYEKISKMPLNEIENNIDELTSNNNLYPYSNIDHFDIQINDFVDTFFENKPNVALNDAPEKNCFGCSNSTSPGSTPNINNSPEINKTKKEDINVLESLVQQLNDLEKFLKHTKHDLLAKSKEIIDNNDNYNNNINNNSLNELNNYLQHIKNNNI